MSEPNDGAVPAVPVTGGRGWTGATKGTDFFTGRGSGREAAMDGNGTTTRTVERARGDRLQDPLSFERFAERSGDRIRVWLYGMMGAYLPLRVAEHDDELLPTEFQGVKKAEMGIEPIYSGAPLAKHIGKHAATKARDGMVEEVTAAVLLQARNWTLFELTRAVFRLVEGPIVVREKRFGNGGGR